MGSVAGSTTVHTTFTSSGTFNPPAGTSASNPLICTVSVTGGGGGGGGFLSNFPGNGGNAGQVITGTRIAVTGAVTVVVGAGGAAGTLGAAGTTGGTSSFGSLAAIGGPGGAAGGTAPATTSLMPAISTGGRAVASVAFSNLVGMGSDSLVSRSADGVSWTTSAGPAGTWLAPTFGGGVYMVYNQLGSTGVYTSPDGITWTFRTGIGGFSAISSIFAYGLHIVVGNGTTYVTSPDGITWTSRTLPTSDGNLYLVQGDTKLLAIGASKVLATTDGITWTHIGTQPVVLANALTGFGNGLFVSPQSNTNTALTSPDGITWTSRTLPATRVWRQIAYGNGVFVTLAGSEAFAATSPDGITWTSRTLPAALGWNNLLYSGSAGKFVTTAYPNQSYASPDGITWTNGTISGTQFWALCATPTTAAAGASTPAGVLTTMVPTGGTAGVNTTGGNGGNGGGYAAPGIAYGNSSTAAQAGQVPGAGGGGAGGSSGAGAAGAGAAGVVSVSWTV